MLMQWPGILYLLLISKWLYLLESTYERGIDDWKYGLGSLISKASSVKIQKYSGTGLLYGWTVIIEVSMNNLYESEGSFDEWRRFINGIF